MTPYQGYELTEFPTSLFKDNLMRKAVKAQLEKSLTNSVKKSDYERDAVHIVDG